MRRFWDGTRGLVKRRPLESLFLSAALAASAAVFFAFKANASAVLLEVEGDGRVLPLVNAYWVSAHGTLFDLDRRGRGWALDSGDYAQKLLIALPRGGLAEVTRVRAVVGNSEFEFKAEDFDKFPVRRLGVVENREWDVHELPWKVRDRKSLFPNFTPVNWRGDVGFCLGAGLRFLLYALGLALVFRFSILTEGGSPPAGSLSAFLSSSNRTVWSVRLADRSPELNLGRPFHLALVFLLTVGVVGSFAVFQVDPHHDGVFLKPAIDVAAGKTLFRDTFTQYGALSVWAYALAVKAAGGTLIAVRLLTAFVYGLTAVLMWLVYARFLPNYLNTFSCLSWLFLGFFFLNYPAMFIFPTATVFAVCSVLLSLHLLLKFLEGGGLGVLFAAGFVTALTFWFKINYGAASFLATLLLLCLLQLREGRGRAARVFAAFFGGALSAHALFALWLAVHGSLDDFVLQSVRLALAFSGYNLFTTNDPAVVRVLKCLFQVDSPHGGISYLWIALPVASSLVFFRYAYAFAVGRDPRAKTPALLAVSAAAMGLWLGYYPVTALFHMYLSSVLFFGLLSHLVLSAAGRLGFSGNRLLVLAILTMMFLPDLSYRLKSFVYKAVWYSSWERIETPGFLRGMRVPAREKNDFAELEALIRRAPGRLINLTSGGLFSLFEDGGADLHKMSMDWGYVNSFLYPDYIRSVAGRIAAGDGPLLSHDAYMVPGYVPVKVFGPFTGGEHPSRPVVLLLPGRRSGGLKFEGVDAVRRPGVYDRHPVGYRFTLKAGAGVAPIASVAVKIISKDTVQPIVARYPFEYELLPRVFDPAAKAVIGARYLFDGEKNAYAVDSRMGSKEWLELMEALSGVFLYEKSSFIADTFIASDTPAIAIFRNGRVIDYGELFSGVKVKAGDRMAFVAPAPAIADEYVAVIRINFKGGTYQEERVKVFGS